MRLFLQYQPSNAENLGEQLGVGSPTTLKEGSRLQVCAGTQVCTRTATRSGLIVPAPSPGDEAAFAQSG
jgi:hypothetical protein